MTMSFKNLKAVMKSMRSKLIDSGNLSKKEIQEIADRAVTIITGVTRSGKSPIDGSRIKPLQPKTVDRRKDLSKSNSTSDVFSPKRSNLNLVGAFLKSIKAELDTDKQRIIIEPKGNHPGYVTKSGARTKSVKNKDILKGQRDMGREFLGLSEKWRKQLTQMMKRFYRKKLARLKQK